MNKWHEICLKENSGILLGKLRTYTAAEIIHVIFWYLSTLGYKS